MPADMSAYVPSLTYSIYRGMRNTEKDNLGLIFTKYIDTWGYDNKGVFKVNSGKFIKNFNNPNLTQAARDILKALNGKIQNMVKYYRKELGFEVCELDKLTQWRLAVGLGAAHVLETNLSFDFLYGVPVIPGSSIKGMTRAYAEFDNVSDDKIKEVFGSLDNEGKVIFFDAYPIETFKLKADVMTPHYPDYYTGNKWPTDNQSPIPIPFITVENTSFKFIIAYKKDELKDDLGSEVQTWLTKGLEMMGMGAKTAVGYGYFA